MREERTMSALDPAIAAIADHEAAYARFARAIDKCEESNASEADHAEWIASEQAEQAAAFRLARTQPTTIAGAMAYLECIVGTLRPLNDEAIYATALRGLELSEPGRLLMKQRPERFAEASPWDYAIAAA
jgi:hypothetical protein